MFFLHLIMKTTLAITSALVALTSASPVATLLPRADSSDLSVFNSNTPSSPEIDALKEALEGVTTFAGRQNILLPNPPDATNLTFSFVNNTVTGKTGGTIALGTRESFPALIGTEVAQAFGWVNACGLNVPHSHPRANEWLTVISGQLIGGLLLEANNGGLGEIEGEDPPELGPLPEVNVTMNPFTGMLFPQGQTHWQFNPTCEPALFTAAFDSSDPGRLQVARNFFSNYPDKVIQNALGDVETLSPSDLETIRGQIPNAYAVVMEDCAKKCGL